MQQEVDVCRPSGSDLFFLSTPSHCQLRGAILWKAYQEKEDNSTSKCNLYVFVPIYLLYAVRRSFVNPLLVYMYYCCTRLTDLIRCGLLYKNSKATHLKCPKKVPCGCEIDMAQRELGQVSNSPTVLFHDRRKRVNLNASCTNITFFCTSSLFLLFTLGRVGKPSLSNSNSGLSYIFYEW